MSLRLSKKSFGIIIWIAPILIGCSEQSATELDSTVVQQSEPRITDSEDTPPPPDWSNPALSPFGASIGNIIRGYFLIGDFERLRQHIVYPECYSPEEIDHLLRTSEWGYDINLSNLKWNIDSTEFIITYKSIINQTTGMDQYKGTLENDSAKLYFFPNNKTRFRYTGKDEFESLCELKNALSEVLFEVDKATILPNSKIALRKIVDYFKSRDAEQAIIIGHTSSEGGIQHNQELSEERAKAIYDHLKKSGVNMAGISYIGKGSSEPLFPNDIEENRIKNRRVIVEFP